MRSVLGLILVVLGATFYLYWLSTYLPPLSRQVRIENESAEQGDNAGENQEVFRTVEYRSASDSNNATPPSANLLALSTSHPCQVFYTIYKIKLCAK